VQVFLHKCAQLKQLNKRFFFVAPPIAVATEQLIPKDDVVVKVTTTATATGTGTATGRGSGTGSAYAIGTGRGRGQGQGQRHYL